MPNSRGSGNITGNDKAGYARITVIEAVNSLTVYVKDKGVWKEGELYIKEEGTWNKKDIDSVFVKEDGTWVDK